MRGLRVLVLAVLALALGAAPATALPLLSEGDAAELAQSLAEATAEQGVCYGWSVLVSDQSGGQGGIDSGSSSGPGTPLGASVSLDCTKSVVLEGSVTYTCSSCEAEDSSSARVVSSFPGGPTMKDLEDLGLDAGQLKSDDGDVALANMVGALPIIAASKGAAPALEADALIGPTGAAATDRPTGSPSTPDWLRESWLPLAVCLLALLGGVTWLVTVLLTDRHRTRAARPAAPRPAPTPFPADPPASEDR